MVSKDACKYVDRKQKKKKKLTALTINDVTYQFPQIKNADSSMVKFLEVLIIDNGLKVINTKNINNH